MFKETKNTKRPSGFSLLLCVLVVSVSALIMSKMSSTRSLNQLENAVNYRQSAQMRLDLRSCVHELLYQESLGVATDLPAAIMAGGHECRVSGSRANGETSAVISLLDRQAEVALSFRNEDRLQILSWRYQ